MQLQIPLPSTTAINPAAGERAKAAGMAKAATNTAPDWADACDRAIAVMARRGVEFQAADLIAEGLVGEPDHPNRWGPRFAAAARHGLIEAAGWAPSKRATVRSSACRTWRGTHAAREERAA